jgi:hypothetical protein
MGAISFVLDGRSMAGCMKQIFFIAGRLEQLLLLNETFPAFSMALLRLVRCLQTFFRIAEVLIGSGFQHIFRGLLKGW